MSQEPNDTAGSGAARRTIPVDTEHFGVRFIVPTAAFSAALVWHIVGLSVLPDLLDGVDALCIVLPFDFVVFFAMAFGVERLLKARMPSRRMAELSASELALIDRRSQPPIVTRIDWAQKVNVLAWRFAIRRRTRVPKGWYCIAVQLLQDESDLILYTFMSPDDAERVSGYRNFVRLRSRRETESNTDLSAVAEQRRLLKLEDARWTDGCELRPEDFTVILEIIEDVVPGWA
jgi:hypothetical protein